MTKYDQCRRKKYLLNMYNNLVKLIAILSETMRVGYVLINSPFLCQKSVFSIGFPKPEYLYKRLKVSQSTCTKSASQIESTFLNALFMPLNLEYLYRQSSSLQVLSIALQWKLSILNQKYGYNRFSFNLFDQFIYVNQFLRNHLMKLLPHIHHFSRSKVQGVRTSLIFDILKCF